MFDKNVLRQNRRQQSDKSLSYEILAFNRNVIYRKSENISFFVFVSPGPGLPKSSQIASTTPWASLIKAEVMPRAGALGGLLHRPPPSSRSQGTEPVLVFVYLFVCCCCCFACFVLFCFLTQFKVHYIGMTCITFLISAFADDGIFLSEMTSCGQKLTPVLVFWIWKKMVDSLTERICRKLKRKH